MTLTEFASGTEKGSGTSVLNRLQIDHAKEVLGIVATGGKSHREVASMGQYVEADYHGRCLIELLQNANDQAVKAGIKRPVVTIFRERDFLAVANQGDPFDENGLNSVTSLGLSSKDPNELIGNKGIGFKAVFEVSSCPEIFSAPNRDGSFASPGAIAFRLSVTPFAGPDGEAFLSFLVEQALAARPEDKVRLGMEASAVLADEIRQAAPFKFPIEVTSKAAHERFLQIAELPADAQTLVVLPIVRTQEIDATITRALDELTARDGAMILFLTGVTELRIFDRTRNLQVVISKDRTNEVALPAEVARHSIVVTSIATRDQPPAVTTWQVVESTFGGADHPQQAQELNLAARKLPGTRWDCVERVPVAIALPMPASSTIELGARATGFICIGLPTQSATGTRAWINSHFFGTISRKDVDLQFCTFNRLLFEEAVRLHGVLLRRLRSGALEERRLATLAFDATSGPLQNSLFAAGGAAEGLIILADDGESFVHATEVLLVEESDATIAAKVLTATIGKESVGRLPEIILATNAAPLLQKLVPRAGLESVRAAMLKIDSDGVCALERAAKAFRDEGPAFWEPFLQFCLKLDATAGRLREIRIFPVTTARLATSDEVVFIPPASGDTQTEKGESDDAFDRDLLSALPASVTGRLNLLDISSIQVRQAGSRRLTELAVKMSRDPGPLVRRPRHDELINSALVPALELLGATERDLSDGLQLLGVAGKWMLEMSDEAKARVANARLKIPVQARNPQGWKWAVARECYFGSGWLDGISDVLLSEAFGTRDGALLIPWNRVSYILGETSRDEWTRLLTVLGVNPRPRLLSWTKPFPAPLEAVSRSHLGIRQGESCPIPTAKHFWIGYLEKCRMRAVSVVSRQPFTFDRVTWIDGIEEEHSRKAVMQMVLREPQYYENYASTMLGRADYPGQDVSFVPSLWIHAITSNDWEVIPAGGTIRKPSECWLVTTARDTARQSRFDFLTVVDPDYRGASRILIPVGVADLENPSVKAILAELERIALRAISNPSSGSRLLTSMAEDLYGRLQRQLRDDAVENLAGIEALPLVRDGMLIGVQVDKIKEAWHIDDSSRALLIPEIESKLSWPFSPRARVVRLVAWLQKCLGPSAVLLTSEAAVNSGFSPIGPPIPLFDWVRARFGAWHQVMTDLGCLIAYTGNRDTDPTKAQFHEHWAKFRRATVTIGRFAGENPDRVFVDAAPGLPVGIQASANLAAADILCETWRLVGESYEDSWRLYHHALRTGAEPALQFLKTKRITDKERDDVDAEIGLAPADRLDRLKACVYALRTTRPGETIESFERAWQQHMNPLSTFVRWCGAPFTDSFVNDIAFQASEEIAFTELISKVGIDAESWQRSRELLGQQRYRFGGSAELWNATRAQIAAILRTSFARMPSIELESAEPIIARVLAMTLPTAIAEAPPTFRLTLAAVVASATEALIGFEPRALAVATSRLGVISGSAATTPHEIKVPDGAPDRDVREYREVAESERNHSAITRYQLYVEIASLVAESVGEIIDDKSLKDTPRILLLLNGPWANRFCVIAMLQYELRRLAPKTHDVLSDRGAFKQDYGPNELRAMFPEIRNNDATIPPPVRKMALFGLEISENELSKEIAPDGRVGESINAAAQKQEWILSHFAFERPDLQPRATPRRGGGSTGSRRAPRENEHDTALNGRLGEIFIYEVLRKLELPAFDSQCWLSTNRCEYTGYPDGDDSAGCDFRVRDEGGKLTGRSDNPLCLIEVKSSSGSADGPFKITENEWKRATAAHLSGIEEYLVVRVADVRGTPTIADIIRDPYALLVAGKLRFWGGDLNVEVGRTG